jgi:8-oxo-dGTP diphosphatase
MKLYIQRAGGSGEGFWGFPGGKLEEDEDPRHCAEREAFEEIGVRVRALRQYGFSSYYDSETGIRWITLIYAGWTVDTPVRKEPEKVADIRWALECPIPVFAPLRALHMEMHSGIGITSAY